MSSTSDRGQQVWASSNRANTMWDCDWGARGTTSYSQGRSAWGGAAWNNKYESSCRPISQVPYAYTAIVLTQDQLCSMVDQTLVVNYSASQGGQYPTQRTPLVAPRKGSSGFSSMFSNDSAAVNTSPQANSISPASMAIPASPSDEVRDGPRQDKANSLALDSSIAPAASGDRDVDNPPLDKAADGHVDDLPSVGSAGHADGSCKRCAFFPKGRCLNGKDCSHCHFEHSFRKRFRKPPKQLQESEPQVAGPIGDKLQSQLHEPDCDDGDEGSEHVDEEGSGPLMYAGKVDRFVTFEKRLPIHSTSPLKTEGFGKVYEQDAVAEIDTTEPSTSPSFSDTEEPCSSMKSYTSLGSSPVNTLGTQGTSPNSLSPEASDCEDVVCTVMSATPTSWSEHQRLRRLAALASDAEVPPEEIARRARALLNKLTEERFESLSAQVLALPLTSPRQLAALSHEIFEKATTQQFFRHLYTELCMRLDSHLAKNEGPIGGKSFRRSLVNECQASFERHMQHVDLAALKDLSEEDLFEAQMKIKNHRLGNMRFIGELFVRRLLASKVMPPILHELLTLNTEAALESVSALLSVVGPVYDSDKVSATHRAPLLDAFTVLRRKMTDKAICFRVRCQIRDLLDMRAQGWQARSIQQ